MIDELLRKHRLVSDQVDPRELKVILREFLRVLENDIDGDAVELGCYKGTTSLFLARILEKYNASVGHFSSRDRLFGRQKGERDLPVTTGEMSVSSEKNDTEKTYRKLYLYDSFAGLPEKTTPDNSRVGDNFKAGELAATKSELIRNFKKENLTLPIIKKAWFKDLTDSDMPNKIAFAFFDGDFYESIRDSFRVTAPHFAPHATIMIDDYQNEALPGAARATDEWLRQNAILVKNFRVEQSLGIIYLK